MTLEKVSIGQQAARLSRPFTMIDLVQIDDLVLSVFLCQGTLPLHRHLDQDELFLVYSGAISLESEWGNIVLRTGELAVVPKGVGHRSSSLPQSLVLLLQPRLMVNRRNGDRRLFAVKGEGHLEKASVPSVGRQITVPFKPRTLVHLDTFALHLTLCRGTGPWQRVEGGASLVFCHEGWVTLESESGQISLEGGEVVVVPGGVAYRLSALQQALVIGLQRHEQPGLPLPD
ncbi:MAG: cupin domain-containing protein [Anaerolineae bacterium]|jgi:homogentisate 1,2-dioxygenase